MGVQVSVCCITYNHDKFLAQCLQSLVSQKTTFEFEILVSNDMSTDRSQEIIENYSRLYPNIINDVSPVKNVGMISNFINTIARCKGKYIAFCDGDDYWIDINKLQKQYDYMEKHTDVGLVYGKAKQYCQNKNKYLNTAIGKPLMGFDDLISIGDTIPTLTVFMRALHAINYLDDIKPLNFKWCIGDYPIWLYVSNKQKICFMNDFFGVYRILDESASHSGNIEKKIQFAKSVYDIKKYFCDIYNKSNLKIEWDENTMRFLLHYSNAVFNYNKKELNCLRYYYKKSSKTISVKAKYVLSFFPFYFKFRFFVFAFFS